MTAKPCTVRQDVQHGFEEAHRFQLHDVFLFQACGNGSRDPTMSHSISQRWRSLNIHSAIWVPCRSTSPTVQHSIWGSGSLHHWMLPGLLRIKPLSTNFPCLFGVVHRCSIRVDSECERNLRFLFTLVHVCLVSFDWHTATVVRKSKSKSKRNRNAVQSFKRRI